VDLDLLSRWSWDPSIVGGIVALGAADAVWIRRQPTSATDSDMRRALVFGAGLAALAIALASPLDYLADHVSLLAHMTQHLLLLLVVPALLLVGAPESLLDAVGSVVRDRFPRVLTHPLVILGVSLGALWIWHAPALYEAALRNEPLHAAEHICFLATALLYWWPVLRGRSCPWSLPDPLLIGYLFAAAVTGSMLAALITFSSDLLYPTYAAPSAVAGLRGWLDLTPAADQQLAGLLMGAVGGLWYFGAAIIIFGRWFSDASADDPITSAKGAPR
jgi:cytochrome c oxidase assembly factor CtaG